MITIVDIHFPRKTPLKTEKDSKIDIMPVTLKPIINLTLRPIINLTLKPIITHKKEISSILKLNYLGSKKTLLTEYGPIFEKYLTNGCVFADLFCGTGIVSEYVQNNWQATIIANDLQLYAYVISRARLENYSVEDIKTIEKEQKYMNELFADGFFTENYANKYFTVNNCQKIDGCRQHLNELKDDKIRNYLLASLVCAADKVANTASVYGAFLKKIKTSAQNNLILTDLPNIISDNNRNNRYFNQDLLTLDYKGKIDVLYLDPPYNSRQYGANYHILETICRYDNPELHGITLLPPYPKSTFCSKANNLALSSLEKVINRFPAKIIILSYSSDGIIPYEDIIELFETKGKVTVHEIEYKKFKSQKNDKKDSVVEYLIVVET